MSNKGWKKCSVTDCNNNHYARGLCRKHWGRGGRYIKRKQHTPTKADRELLAKLRAFKRVNNLTHNDLGILLGIKSSYVSHIICFVVRIPKHIRAIIEALVEGHKPRREDYTPAKTRRLVEAANIGFTEALAASGISQAELARRIDARPEDISCVRHSLFGPNAYGGRNSSHYWADILMRISDELEVPVASLAPPDEIELLFSREQMWNRALEADRRMTLPDPTEEFEAQEEIELILSRIPERARVLLSLYFGITDHRLRTLEDVATFFGVTRERVRQLIEFSLDSARHGTSDFDCSWCGLWHGKRRSKFCREQKLSVCQKLLEHGVIIRPPLVPSLPGAKRLKLPYREKRGRGHPRTVARCSKPLCNYQHYAKGLCRNHYQRQRYQRYRQAQKQKQRAVERAFDVDQLIEEAADRRIREDHPGMKD